MTILVKRLGEQIGRLIYGRDKANTMASKCNLLTNKVINKFNMFGAGMEYRIRSHVRSTEVITMQENGKLNASTKFIEQVG